MGSTRSTREGIGVSRIRSQARNSDGANDRYDALMLQVDAALRDMLLLKFAPGDAQTVEAARIIAVRIA